METHDDGFHEIQLNGKQLVFLFMAVTVVSVVIFLCGVLVGRGVRTERAASVVEAPGIAPATAIEPPPSRPAPLPAGSDPTKAAPPPPAGDDLTYFDRLDKKNPPAEQLTATGDKAPVQPKATGSEKLASTDKPQPVEKAAPKDSASVKAPEPAKRPPPASASKDVTAAAVPPRAKSSATADDAVTAEPSGSGFVLQISALKEEGDAEAMARRLTAKGYSAYVLKPAAGTPAFYRVRVGKFKTRHEAETVATKLNKEEQLTPWITR
jgi:DedD protein